MESVDRDLYAGITIDWWVSMFKNCYVRRGKIMELRCWPDGEGYLQQEAYAVVILSLIKDEFEASIKRK